MKTPSFRDMELISAYLDGQLSQSQKTRLEARLATDPSLAAALIELGQMKSLLRQIPHYRAPRNFTLTPKMAGIRPPVPRVVPALSWASAMAMMLFICTLAFNVLKLGPLGAAAPKAVDAAGSGAVPFATSAPAEAPLAATEALLQAPSIPTYAPTPTEEPSPTLAPSPTETPRDTMAFMTQNGTQLTGTHTPSWNDPTPTEAPTSTRVTPTDTREPPTPTREAATSTPAATAEQFDTRMVVPPQEPQPAAPTLSPWLYVWAALAVVLVGTALLIRWLSRLAFEKRLRRR
jgi:hypothetical protein